MTPRQVRPSWRAASGAAKNSAAKWRRRARSWATMAVLPLAVAIVDACPGGDAAVVTDRNPSWDSDGDTISTAVELESHNHNLYLYDTLLFDHNHSIASGTRGAGWLDWGLNLPDTGFGYIHFPNET